VVNAIIGFVQESRAERAIGALAQVMTAEATAQRSGQTQRIAAAELVPADVVWLKAGDKVPADMRLVRSRNLQLTESALTGESVPVEKATDVRLAADVVLAERRNMVYASTLVTYGQQLGVMISIDDSTKVGRISQLISQAEEMAAPLTQKIARSSRIVLYAIVVLAAIAFLVGVLRGQAWLDTMTAAISLAVGMIPEGQPSATRTTTTSHGTPWTTGSRVQPNRYCPRPGLGTAPRQPSRSRSGGSFWVRLKIPRPGSCPARTITDTGTSPHASGTVSYLGDRPLDVTVRIVTVPRRALARAQSMAKKGGELLLDANGCQYAIVCL
jgi:hypothetical protein